MDLMKFDIQMDNEQKKQKEELCKRLLNEQHVQSFLKLNELNEAFVLENTYALKDYVERIKKCDGCAGLAYCTQDVKGHVLSLEVIDEEVEKNLVACKYMKSLDDNLEHKKNIVINDMSEEQMQYRFDTTDLVNENDSYLRLFHYLNENINNNYSEGFYLYGEPGVGKTYLACCYANELAKKGVRCSFVHVPTLIANLKTSMYDNVAFRRTIFSLKDVDVLVLDDIGGESASTWSRDDILLPLLNNRMEHKKKTIFTSNFSYREIEDFYCLKSKSINDRMGAKRLVERMKSFSLEKELIGSNRRVKNSRNSF